MSFAALREEADEVLPHVQAAYPQATACVLTRFVFEELRHRPSAHWPSPLPDGEWSLEKLKAEATELGLDKVSEVRGYVLARLEEAPKDEAVPLLRVLTSDRDLS